MMTESLRGCRGLVGRLKVVSALGATALLVATLGCPPNGGNGGTNGCQSDDECPAGQVCNVPTGVCETPSGQSTALLPSEVVANDVAVQENVASGIARIEVSVPVTGATYPITLDWQTVDGTATAADGDYQAASGSVELADASDQANIDVTIINDNEDEGANDEASAESFTARIVDAATGNVMKVVRVAIIDDDGPAATLSIDDQTATEGTDATAVFTVTLANGGTDTVTVDFHTQSTTATSGATPGTGDFDSTSGTLTFPQGTTEQQISVPINDDATVEQTEQFFITLSNATNATIARAQGIGTILDNDVAPPPGGGGGSPPACPDTVIVDGTFANGDWATTSDDLGTNPTFTEDQVNVGGNPGDYRETIVLLPVGAALVTQSIFQNATYDPSSDGPINSIDYSEDRILTAPPTNGANTVGASLLIEQGGKIWTRNLGAVTKTSWQSAAIAGLTQDSFGTPGNRPDFTATGGPIRFGYVRTILNASASADSVAHGIDNFRVTIHRICP